MSVCNTGNTYLVETRNHFTEFLPRDAMLAWYMLCPSVHLSQVWVFY